MKKLSAILLLSLFIISSNAEWISIFINRVQMRQKIAAAMVENENNLETFSFNKEQFKLVHFSPLKKEINIDGKNFDIADIHEENGKIIVRCLADEKEEQIKQWAKKNQQEKNKQIQNSISKIFTTHPEAECTKAASITIKEKFNSYSSPSLTEVFLDIIVPPPSMG